MKCALPKTHKQYAFYDKALAAGIDCIFELGNIGGEDNRLVLGLKFEDTKADRVVLQMIKIINASTDWNVTLYLNTTKKLYKEIKSKIPSMEIKRVTIFNRHKIFYIMKANYVYQYIKNKFGKNEFFNEQILDEIWDEYYAPHEKDEREEGFDELEDLL